MHIYLLQALSANFPPSDPLPLPISLLLIHCKGAEDEAQTFTGISSFRALGEDLSRHGCLPARHLLDFPQIFLLGPLVTRCSLIRFISCPLC